MSEKKPVIVIGAGPAGMTAAYCLAKAGISVIVYESADQVGGLARSIDLWGQRVDLGPHRFFSTDLRVNKLWLEVAGREYAMVNRLTRIFYSGRFFYYPLQALNALFGLGIFEAVRCVLSYLRQKFRPSTVDQDTFEGWVVSRFGRRLFEIFFKSYSEKLWGISCLELDADFAAQRIKKFSLGEAIKSVLGLGAKHKTLVDKFAYPLGGTGRIYEKMADAVTAKGGVIHLLTPVSGVWCEQGKVRGVHLPDGTAIEAAHVISTMPMTLMARSLGPMPPAVEVAVNSLRFRNTILVYLEAEGGRWFPDQWLYIHSPDLVTGRITNFRNWTPDLYSGKLNTILVLELWCNDEDELWTQDEVTLIATAKKELNSTGLVPASKVMQGKVVRLPRCYPVYERGYREHLAAAVDYLKGFDGLTPIGRYGSFKYNNQDHSILMGLLVAENLLGIARHDLWTVNTDYEVYQEQAVIDDTGLSNV